MRKIIEKFYSLIFEDKETQEEEVPFANKAFMFYFSIIVTSIVFALIISDIAKNIEKINAVP